MIDTPANTALSVAVDHDGVRACDLVSGLESVHTKAFSTFAGFRIDVHLHLYVRQICFSMRLCRIEY